MPTAFDPFTATLPEALAEQARWQAETGKQSDSCMPLARCTAAAQVSARRQRCEAANGGFEVLLCIRDCVTNGLVAPEWLAYAYNRRFDAVLNCRVGSWHHDQAFGRPYPKGTHLAALRKARRTRYAVVLAVHAALELEPAPAIDGALFEAVGRPLGLGKTLTANLYYETRDRLALSMASRPGDRSRTSAKTSKLAVRRRPRR